MRPDIAHQALLALLDSPLAKAGKIKVCVCGEEEEEERERRRGGRGQRGHNQHQTKPPPRPPFFLPQALYVHTAANVLIQINPSVRLPRTFKRFCGLFVQLLHKLSIRASNGPSKLLRVVKGPVERHLPPGAPRIALSRVAPDAVSLKSFAAGLGGESGGSTTTPVFVVGAQAHGQAVAPYVDRWISISQYPLSAACVLSRITGALEDVWGVS